MAWHDIGAAAALDHGPLVAAIGYVDVIVWRVDGTIHATDRWCPHARGDLSGAAVANGSVTCGDHGWAFELATGACIKSPGRYTLPTYRCHVRGGRIEIELPDDAPS
jgi:nitrite reductase/ring-hydroxylating ferredoxin subunit